MLQGLWSTCYYLIVTYHKPFGFYVSESIERKRKLKRRRRARLVEKKKKKESLEPTPSSSSSSHLQQLLLFNFLRWVLVRNSRFLEKLGL
jgi:hypothetical protein